MTRTIDNIADYLEQLESLDFTPELYDALGGVRIDRLTFHVTVNGHRGVARAECNGFGQEHFIIDFGRFEVALFEADADEYDHPQNGCDPLQVSGWRWRLTGDDDGGREHYWVDRPRQFPQGAIRESAVWSSADEAVADALANLPSGDSDND